MNENKKVRNIIVLVLVIIAVSLGLIGIILMSNTDINNNVKEEKEEKLPTYRKNTSKVLQQAHIFEEYVFSNINLTSYDFSCFEATVTNQSSIDRLEQTYFVVFFDHKNQELGTIEIVIPALKSGESNLVLTESKQDIVEAYDFQIRAKK